MLIQPSISAKPKGGFTLIEVLVVIVIIAIAASLVFPALLAAHQSADDNRCENNLRQIGVALLSRSTRFGGGRPLVTGAWMAGCDGDPTRVGWVPDVLEETKFDSEVLLCRSNGARQSEAICLDRLQLAYLKGQLPSTVISGADDTLLDFQKQMIDVGFNANYCQAWTLARTDMKPLAGRTGVDPSDPLDPGNSWGPASERDLLRVGTARSMLLGDAASIVEYEEEHAVAITRGPVNPFDETSVHDFSGFGLIHGRGNLRHANVLFADGHVESICDADETQSLDVSDVAPVGHVFGLRYWRPEP